MPLPPCHAIIDAAATPFLMPCYARCSPCRRHYAITLITPLRFMPLMPPRHYASYIAPPLMIGARQR
jgi:hypothetical protein